MSRHFPLRFRAAIMLGLLSLSLAAFPTVLRAQGATPSAAPPAASPSATAASPAASASATAGPPPSASAPTESKVSQATAALARVQTLIEFYFMETGSYPESIDDMLAQYNQGVRQNETPVGKPTDPATGKNLVYTPNADRSGYVVQVPEPAAYGLTSLGVKNLDWGWMAQLAAQQRKKRQMLTCGRYQELLAGVIEQYNKDHRNKYPDSVDALIPKYLKSMPVCPECHKPYLYTHNERGFEVSCPCPEAHGLKKFSFGFPDGPKQIP